MTRPLDRPPTVLVAVRKPLVIDAGLAIGIGSAAKPGIPAS